MTSIVNLKSVKDLFFLKQNSKIFKKNLSDLIQFSKIENSEYFTTLEDSIRNTPQQGINWVGTSPMHK